MLAADGYLVTLREVQILVSSGADRVQLRDGGRGGGATVGDRGVSRPTACLVSMVDRLS